MTGFGRTRTATEGENRLIRRIAVAYYSPSTAEILYHQTDTSNGKNSFLELQFRARRPVVFMQLTQIPAICDFSGVKL